MNVRCRIEVFGELRVIQGDQTHTRFRTHKAGLLLAYLALHMRGAQPRERLLDTFWPDMEPTAARDNLSTILSQLRRQLEPTGVPAGSILLADRQQVHLNAEAVSVDAGDFDRLMLLAKGTDAAQAKMSLLQEAVTLYRGELLPGCYEEWATREQTRFQSAYLECLVHLMQAFEETGRWAEALEYAQKATIAAPYTEDSYQARMRLLVRLKRPAVALETYEELARLFERELGAPPSATTRQMAEMIRRDPRAAVPLRAAAANRSATPITPMPPLPPAQTTLPSSTPAPTVSPLPLHLSRFYGREQETKQLADLLQTPGTRLISILGPGGAGKTRLSIEIAAQVMAHSENRFADRVWFVPLADVPDPSLIPAALANTLRLPLDARADPLDRILAHLDSAPCLLVLDNLEHLLRETLVPGKNENPSQSGTPVLIGLLLQRVPNLVCLVTSRQPLRLGGEIEFSLPALPMPFPTERAEQRKGDPNSAGNDLAPLSSAEVTALLTFPSVQLYVDRARVARPDFALTPHNAPFVAALCRRLEGMPLAIEMAAAWVKTLPPQKMLDRLERQLDLLVSRRRDLPPRHQSLRATIEWSYNLLLPDLRDVLEQMTVFRGGWTLEAAEALCGPDALHALLALQEQSLIVVEEEDVEENSRYRMLEPLREFGWERLQQARCLDVAQAAHADYFYKLAQEARQHYNGGNEKTWLDRIQADLDNVRAASDWYLHAPDKGMQSLKLALALIRFWTVRGYIAEGRQYLRTALEGAIGQEESALVADALMCEGNLAWYASDYETARTRFESSQALHERLGNTRGAAMLYNSLANTALMQEDYERAHCLLEEGLRLNRQMNDRENLAALSGSLGSVQEKLGDRETAGRLYQESLTLWREIGNQHAVAVNLNNLGILARKSGDYASASTYSRESLQIRRTINDRSGIVLSLIALAAQATLEGQAPYAATLYAAAEALRVHLGVGFLTMEREEHEANISRLRALLPAPDWEAAQAQGCAFTQEQAIAFALQED